VAVLAAVEIGFDENLNVQYSEMFIRKFSAILGSEKTPYPIALAAFSCAESASTSAEDA
jgi:hypothetical protein